MGKIGCTWAYIELGHTWSSLKGYARSLSTSDLSRRQKRFMIRFKMVGALLTPVKESDLFKKSNL